MQTTTPGPHGIACPESTASGRRQTTALALAGLLLAGLALAGFAAAAGPAAESPGTTQAPPRDFYGVVPQVQLEPDDFARLQEDNVGIVRQLFLWPAIQPEPGPYDWRVTDEAVRQASASGIQIFPVLYGTPSWAQSEELTNACGVTCAPSTPEARHEFARFAGAAVERYGPGGSFWADPPPPPPSDPPPNPPPDPCKIPPLLCERAAPTQSRRGPAAEMPIDVWQVWNEQNTPKYFGPTVNVPQYVSLAKQVAAEIRGRDPSAEIVLGGMWGPPDTDGLVPTLRYLKRLYRIEGSREAFDSIAVHPYAGELRSVKRQLRGVRRLAGRVGDPDVGMWVSEVGWASGGRSREPLVKSPAQQAALLRKTFRFLIRKRLAWRIRSVHWYSWRDTPLRGGICEWCPKSGLRTSGGEEKPAAVAFRNLPRSG